MKKVILSISVLAMLGLTSCKNEKKQEQAVETSKEIVTTDITFGVRGNCGMCKKTIENAVNNMDGIANAVWDVDKKKIAVSFDASKTNEIAIHKAIATSGYDTDKVLSNEESYKKLPGCCQYDHEMTMNQVDK